MHLDFRVKPENDRKDTFGTSPLTAAAGFAVTVANVLFASSTASSFADGGIRATYSPAARSLRFKTWFFWRNLCFLLK